MRPPSREGHISVQGHDEDYLSSALHAALSSFAPGSSAHNPDQLEMIKEKERAGIDIVVDSDCLALKGTGVDVEPVVLKGHILLHLTEPTSIKEITLQFRGKAKLPLPSAETLALGTSQQWYTICNHEWSFLEGEKRHGHTLKAGFHQFPFQLQLGGSLPSSITSGVYGGAHVSYKLRAVAVRPGLAHNMQAVMPISIVRTFAPEALEYQQSLEIENTWPEKLMYSIMIPHKAWAAGDQLTAIVKFQPLSKGVRVLTVTTTIHEITKLHCRGGVQEHTRSVVTAHHDIPNGSTERHAATHATPLVPASFHMTPGLSSEDRSQSFGSLVALANQDNALRQVSTSASSHESHSTAAPPPPSGDTSAFSAEPVASTSTAVEEVPMSQDDIFAQLTLSIPKSVTPSHPLEPIAVFHRIRWSIYMSNLDGHTSELRCSLPLHILDARLLDEARANSAATRRLLLEGPEAPVDEDHDAELPSYSAHVRDRVANMYLPDSATARVFNPWVHSNVSPTFMPEYQSLSGAWSPSGAASPVAPHPVSSYLPHVPQSGTSTPLEWVNSELLLSLSNTAPPRPRSNTSPHSHSPDPGSRPDSGPISRRGSRAPSPDHLTMTTITPFPAAPITTSHETFVHDGHASRTLPGLFRIQMKPQTSLTSPAWLSRSNSHSNLASLADGVHVHRAPQRQPSTMTLSVPVPVPGSQVSTPTSATSESVPESTLWHRAFTEVPDYDVASRGFIGGVTPLTSMRGLPSYEEAERSAYGGGGVDDEGRLTIRRPAPRREGVS
ncbi:hypothetical protein OG21DRAFT_1411919 [Imleria badia]|nr:hypothetical protein OG21DRAFT_1411919 [Imleria badia]